jgi:ribonuclease-3 family protein
MPINLGGLQLKNYFALSMDRHDIDTISALGLAHCGDAVFELLVRAWLCDCGRATKERLHVATVRYVRASAQSARVERLLPLLTDEELAQYRRGRNAHTRLIPKGATHEEYSRATGLECLFGYLYLLGRTDRVNELFVKTMEEDHAD